MNDAVTQEVRILPVPSLSSISFSLFFFFFSFLHFVIHRMSAGINIDQAMSRLHSFGQCDSTINYDPKSNLIFSETNNRSSAVFTTLIKYLLQNIHKGLKQQLNSIEICFKIHQGNILSYLKAQFRDYHSTSWLTSSCGYYMSLMSL